MKKNRFIYYTIGAVVIAALTIFAVISNNGDMTFEEFMDVLRAADPFWLTMAGVSMFGFIFFEGEALRVLLNSAGYKKSVRASLLYSSSDIYFSAITPSASGGQPASAYFMMRDGVPAAVTTVMLVANLVMYTMGILTVAVFCLLFKWRVFRHFDAFAQVLIFLGMAVLTFLAVVFIALLRHGEWLAGIGNKFIGALSRLHLMKRPEKWRMKLETTVEDYRRCSDAVSGKKTVLIRVYLMNLLQRVSQITVAVMVYFAIGGTLKGSSDIWAIQAYAQIGSNTVPIPGGMGVADYLMLNGYTSILEKDYAFHLAVISRGISFYICTLLGLLFVIFGYLIGRRHHRVKGKTV